MICNTAYEQYILNRTRLRDFLELEVAQTYVSWLVTNVDLSQIIDFLLPQGYPINFFPIPERGWMELVYLSAF